MQTVTLAIVTAIKPYTLGIISISNLLEWFSIVFIIVQSISFGSMRLRKCVELNTQAKKNRASFDEPSQDSAADLHLSTHKVKIQQ